MASAGLGISRQANVVYRTTTGVRHERNWATVHLRVRRQQLCPVIRAQAEEPEQLLSKLPSNSVKSSNTPAHQVRNAVKSRRSAALLCIID